MRDYKRFNQSIPTVYWLHKVVLKQKSKNNFLVKASAHSLGVLAVFWVLRSWCNNFLKNKKNYTYFLYQKFCLRREMWVCWFLFRIALFPQNRRSIVLGSLVLTKVLRYMIFWTNDTSIHKVHIEETIRYMKIFTILKNDTINETKNVLIKMALKCRGSHPLSHYYRAKLIDMLLISVICKTT